MNLDQLPDGCSLSAALTLPAELAVGQKFTMQAYDGGKLRVGNFPAPVVVDLKGLSQRDQVKALLHHKPDRPAGFMESVEIGVNSIKTTGKFTHEDTTRDIAAAQQQGFKWDASIGATFDRETLEVVQAGQSAFVNGRHQAGPFVLIRKARLNEVSFVGLGAGDNTNAAVLMASAWLEASATDSRGAGNPPVTTHRPRRSAMADDNKETSTLDKLQAQLEAQTAELEAQAKRSKDLNDRLEAQYKAHELQNKKLTAQSLAKQYELSEAEQTSILAQIGEGKLSSEAEIKAAIADLTFDRRGQKIQPWQGKQGAPATSAVLEAQLLLTMGRDESQLKNLGYGEKEINAAIGKPIGLKGIVRQVLRAHNTYCDEIGEHDINAAMGFAGSGGSLEAAASSVLSLPELLSNVMNKTLLEGRLSVARVIPRIAMRGTATDYKQIKMIRVDPSGELKEIGPDGEARSIGMSEEAYTNQAKQYAGYLGVTEQMIVNDDLNAFNMIGRGFGRIASKTEERLGFKTLLASADTFWTEVKGNRIPDGTTNAFGLTSLTTAVTAFLNMGTGITDVEKETTSKDDPMLMEPKLLLLPNSALVDARSIYNDTLLITGANSTKTANNPHKGLYEPLSSAYLNSGFHGNSTQWLLLADPAQTSPLHVVYMNGRATPRLKRWDRMPGKYVVQFDCDHVFGFSLFDDMASVYAKGQA